MVNQMWLMMPGPLMSARTFFSPGSMGQASLFLPETSQLATRFALNGLKLTKSPSEPRAMPSIALPLFGGDVSLPAERVQCVSHAVRRTEWRRMSFGLRAVLARESRHVSVVFLDHQLKGCLAPVVFRA